eukprot:CAMPEP_0184483060 /NCGR_PEP_ID=MMETSP0113_2-20130426/4664_1 /TAXON_ID=91329 /ORGANISM="Norrisiella sphaerica, Strain BC52" /LENGTH=178 /DNA_ID=CAMNT_0026863197 /DNA_START=95 /DNA_END=631 /DNA_ORIENTATION=+
MDDLWDFLDTITIEHPQPPRAIDVFSYILETLHSKLGDISLPIEVIDIVFGYARDPQFLPDIGERSPTKGRKHREAIKHSTVGTEKPVPRNLTVVERYRNGLRRAINTSPYDITVYITTSGRGYEKLKLAILCQNAEVKRGPTQRFLDYRYPTRPLPTIIRKLRYTQRVAQMQLVQSS